MIGAVVITHGRLASALVEAAASITGDAGEISTICLDSSSSSDDIRKELDSAVRKADSGRGVLIFTDMLGGTPSNIALSMLREGEVEVMMGVNLPILIKFIGNRAEKTLGEIAPLLKEYGHSSITLAGDILKESRDKG